MAYEIKSSVSEAKPFLNPQNVTYLIEMFDIKTQQFKTSHNF
jgi:hypothetical protein